MPFGDFRYTVPWSATKNEHRRMDVTFFPVNDSRRASDMFYGRSVRCFGDSTGVEATRQPIGTLPLPQINFFETRKSAHGRTSITTGIESHASHSVRIVGLFSFISSFLIFCSYPCSQLSRLSLSAARRQAY